MYYVYGLVDPTNNMISYIGMTGRSPMERLARHIKNLERERQSSKGEWMTRLIESGRIPVVVTLQVANSEQQAQIAERWWIAQGQVLGWPLFNTQHFMRLDEEDALGETEELTVVSLPSVLAESITNENAVDETAGVMFPLSQRRAPTDAECIAIRAKYAETGSKNKTVMAVYGSKSGTTYRYLNEALAGGAA